MATQSVLPVVIGVDIGGTNTDAILLHHGRGQSTVVSEVKEQTTSDVIDGVRKAVLRCLLQAKGHGYTVAPVQANIGTTHFVNAVVQHQHLAKVAVIRVCGPVSKELPPFCDFPTKLADLIQGPIHFVHGGCNYDGSEKEPLDEMEIRQVVNGLKTQGVSNIAVIGIFSPCRSAQELRTKEIVLEVFPEATVSLSHEIGDIGLLERENATILNECLKPLCKKTVAKFKAAFEDIGLDCPFFLTQNDGTIISSSDVLKFPVLTFASGPTNSMRGAAFLTTKTEAVVIDIGGTTSDVGILTKGFPREASMHVKVGGVKTSFRMPDVLSIGLGGGSYVIGKKREDGIYGQVEVGPLSAGYNLKKEALVYAGSEGSSHINSERVLTATDIAVSYGLCSLGSEEHVSHLDSNLVDKAVDKIHNMLEELADKIKLCKEDLPVVIVGGGSVLVDTKRPFKGASELIIPKHFGVANAIGAALSKMSATVSRIVNLLELVDVPEMDKAVEHAKKNVNSSITQDIEHAVNNAKKTFLVKAREEAIKNCLDQAKCEVLRLGVSEESVEVLEKYDSVLSYVPGNGLNIKVKVVGDMIQGHSLTDNPQWNEPDDYENILKGQSQSSYESNSKQFVTSTGQKLSKDVTEDDKDTTTSNPKHPFIDTNTGEWILSEWDIECLVIGAGIYGCGGGGSSEIGRIMALKALRDGKKMRVVAPERFLANADPDRDLVFCPGLIGSPTVEQEQGSSVLGENKAIKILTEIYETVGFKDGDLQTIDGVTVEENELGCRYISNYKPLQVTKKHDRRVVAFMSLEFAGCNAIFPLLAAADMGVPVIDSDGMSRAFPEVQMFIPYMYNTPPYPISIVGSRDDERSVLLYSPSAKFTEYYVRDVCIQYGCDAYLTVPLTTRDVLNKTVFHIISRAWKLGDAILRARLQKQTITDVIVQQENGQHIITGKVVDVKKETTGGFNKGHFIIEGSDECSGENVLIEFQNEFLVIFPLLDGERGENRGSVPDLISVVESDTGEPLQAEVVRYGMRVSVVLIPSCDLLRHPDALKKVSPQGFHYPDDVRFEPLKERKPVLPIPPQ